VGALLVLATTLSTETWVSIETLYSIAIIAFNGLICTLVIPGLLPPLEKLFGITTDIQLLEYSDLNNEVLNELAIKVPATYAHSLMMGQMAEAACDAIGANGLLARVCAYYHDIGKLRRPEYFSENQTGYNIHDDLSPRLSARAIASHVTEGVELAREHHLPQPIIRGILEHHGNSLISFFYVQALEQQKHGDVREEDFRYPGPKPQSRETGILMICDAVESGVRTIKNPNEDRVREFIDKIIQSRSNDRQFDECDLTLKQLDVIGNVLTKIVCSTHHSRVSYPEKPEQEEATNVIHITSGGRN
jgi:putative nucleotidyltransferase with HDIG domain